MTSGTASKMGTGQFWELAGTVVRCLPDMDPTVAQGWIDNPEALREVLGEVLCAPKKTATPNLRAWKTIKLGLHKSPEEYRKALEAGQYPIDTCAGQILDEIPVIQEEVEVDLALVTGSQLGFRIATRRDLIYKRALGLGLQECPAEVGPALREQYPDQPMGEWFLIGMDPIAVSGGSPGVFDVEHCDNGLRLGSSYGGYPGYIWRPDRQWVFVLPRK